MKQLKVPFVSKGRVQKLHRASIAEVWFTGTFEVDDASYRHGQAHADYPSRRFIRQNPDKIPTKWGSVVV
jgi:hypothetical protein